jgi:hypothetical protein
VRCRAGPASAPSAPGVVFVPFHYGRYGGKVREVEAPELWESFMGIVRRKNAELLGRSPKTGLLLLRDLRQL